MSFESVTVEPDASSEGVCDETGFCLKSFSAHVDAGESFAYRVKQARMYQLAISQRLDKQFMAWGKISILRDRQ